MSSPSRFARLCNCVSLARETRPSSLSSLSIRPSVSSQLSKLRWLWAREMNESQEFRKVRLAKRNLSADEFRAVAFALVELLPDLRSHLSRHSLIDYTAQQVATTAQRPREDSRIDLRPPPHQPPVFYSFPLRSPFESHGCSIRRYRPHQGRQPLARE